MAKKVTAIKKKVNLSLDSKIHRRAVREAARLGFSLSAYITTLILEAGADPRPPGSKERRGSATVQLKPAAGRGTVAKP